MIDILNTMNISYNQLLALMAIVDRGSFARAAVHLNLTQSTITKRIQELEAEMGFSIFDRSKRKAVLTQQGELFVSLASDAVQNFQNLAAFNPARLPTPTHIRLGVTELSSLTWLPKFLESSTGRDPNLKFEITIDMSRDLVRQLEDHELDVLVVPQTRFQAQTAVTPLNEVEITLVGNSALLSNSEPIPIEALRDHQVIMQGRSSAYAQSIRQWLFSYGCNLRNSIRTDSFHAMVSLAIAGQGLAVAPKGYLKRVIDAGRLREISTVPKLPSIRYCVAYNPSAHETLHDRIAADIAELADFSNSYLI